MDTTLFIQSPLQQTLKEVPEKIRDWFGSERITNLVIDLNGGIGVEGEEIRVIPKLLLRLEVKDLEPQNFTQELSSQLKVDYEIAKSIAREIKKQILEPISLTLLRWGIDINLIAIGGSLSLSEIKPKIPEEAEIPPAKLPPGTPLQPIEIESSSQLTEPPSITDTKTKLPDFEPVMPSESADKSFDKAQDKPFMIHQEAGVQPVTGRNKVSMPAVGWFKKAMPAGRQEKPKMPESPIKVQLETFGPKIEERKEPTTAKTETPKQRVVHYREVENPAPFGKSGTQPPKESQPSKIEASAIKPFDTAQGKSEPLKSSMPGKSFGVAQDRPFGTAPSGKAQSGQGGPEQPTKPAEPKVIDLESFFEVTEKKENGIKNEVGLDGNTINLKNNKT